MRVPLLAAAGLVVAACGGGGERSAGSSVDAAATDPAAVDSLAADVGAFLLRYAEATSTRDTARLRAMYVADGRFVWLEDGAIRYRSPDAVLRGLSAFPPEMPVRTVLGEVEAAPLAGGVVHAWTPFSTTVGQGDGAFAFEGILSLTLERHGDAWRIVGGHTSTGGGR